jgi:hypothetical protein
MDNRSNQDRLDEYAAYLRDRAVQSQIVGKALTFQEFEARRPARTQALMLTEAQAATLWDAVNDRAEQLEDQASTEVGLPDDVVEDLNQARRDLEALRDTLDELRLRF